MRDEGYFPHREPDPPGRLSKSWEPPSFLSRFGRRPSGELADVETPLLGEDQAASPSAAWPALTLTLRQSSVTTRKLKVGSWSEEQVATPLAGGFPSPFLSQPSPRAQEPLPFLSSVAAEALQPPSEAADAAGGGAGGGFGGTAGAGQGLGPGAERRPSRRDRLANAAVCGVVNAVVALPIMLSFAAIIFRDPFFRPLLGSLVKVVFLSSALHQMAFTIFSSLPFAVGQVQDVGLIFLSAMASDVVWKCGQAGVSEADTVATALTMLTLSTAAVGLLIILTGVLKLASLVQYVPLPVVGGYLAYVGYFCLMAGISLASGVQVSTPETWVNLADRDALIKLAPALGTTMLIALTLRRFRSPFALPALLVAVPAVFYGVLWAAGLSLDDARDAGWVTKPQVGDSDWQFWKAWGLYNLKKFPPDNIYWAAMPSQLAKLVALYFVVAFGSSMDVAAIQAESPRDLDYNSELTTVGISNLISGLSGMGYTGSYIFSQTLFSMRMSVDTPLMGAIIAGAELVVFMIPVNAMAYLPNLFFGSLVMWIGQDILKDWLFIAYKRVSLVEYALLVGTLCLIMALGLEAGIAAGVVAAAVHFAYRYSKVSVNAFSVVPSRSGAVRTFEQRTALEMFAARITAVSLSGYLFFGSSVKVSERVVAVAVATLESQPHKSPEKDGGPPPASSAHFHAEHLRQQAKQAQQQQQQRAGGPGHAPGPAPEGLPIGGAPGRSSLDGSAPFGASPPPNGGSYMPPRALPTVISGIALDATYDAISHFSGLSRELAAAALQHSPRFLILDFRRVQGLDATAARTFVTLHTKLHRMGIQLIITHLPGSRPGIQKLLVAQGLILRQPSEAAAGGETEEGGGGGPVCRWFATMEAGLQFCEDQFLDVAVRYRLCRPTPTCVSLAEVLRAHLEFPRSILPIDLDCAAAASLLARFTVHEELRAGQVLFERGDASDDIYVLECGSVLCAVDFMHASVHSRAVEQELPPDLHARYSNRLLKYGPGGIVGELDFFLQRPRSFSAVADGQGAAWRIDRRSFERMAREQPQVLALLQTIILRSTCLSAAHALEALERSSPE